MSQPVNLENLREITGGDREIEAELFKMFLDTATECLTGLTQALQTGSDEAWRKQAHAFKGISYNLGAENLGELCRQAQDAASASVADKTLLLAKLQDELTQVRTWLAAVNG
jgi:HPt (histidine-containing phosphotransfer) domain-containing protein